MKTQLRQIFKQIRPLDVIPRLVYLCQAFSSFLGKLIFVGIILLLFLAYVMVKILMTATHFTHFSQTQKSLVHFLCELQNHVGKLETVMMKC